jgi:hypothetical protein
MHINRHEVKILEEHHWNSAMCCQLEGSEDEFLVNTAISKIDEQNEDIDGNKRDTYTGTRRKYFYPDAAAGWLFDGEGGILMREEEKKGIKKEKLNSIKQDIQNSRSKKNSTKRKSVGSVTDGGVFDTLRSMSNKLRRNTLKISPSSPGHSSYSVSGGSNSTTHEV